MTVPMVDFFAIGLTHALLALAAWRLMVRPELDSETTPDHPPAGETPGA